MVCFQPSVLLSINRLFRFIASSRNIARGKQTSQSSTTHSGVSNRAIDGNKNPDFHSGKCTHTSQENEAWWSVDLGKPCLVHSLMITNRGDCCGNRLSNFDVTVDDRL